MPRLMLTIPITLVYLCAIANAAAVPRQENSVVELNDMDITYYYDAIPRGTDGVCGPPNQPKGWNDQYLDSFFACSKDNSNQTVANMNNANLVAVSIVDGGSKVGQIHCGKEQVLYKPTAYIAPEANACRIKVYGPDGKQIVHDGKPFVVFDKCPGCPGFDLSASAIVSIDPNGCSKGRLHGYRGVITNNVILESAGDEARKLYGMNGEGFPGGHTQDAGAGAGAMGAAETDSRTELPTGAPACEQTTSVAGRPNASPSPRSTTGLQTGKGTATCPHRHSSEQDDISSLTSGASSPSCPQVVDGQECSEKGQEGCGAGVRHICNSVINSAPPVWQRNVGPCIC